MRRGTAERNTDLPHLYGRPLYSAPPVAIVVDVTSYYRVHAANESLDTILDPARLDGWTMSDESEVGGLAVCTSIEALSQYVSTYGMSVVAGDRVVRVEGSYAGPDHDAHACRCNAVSYEVLGDARDWLDACAELEEICNDWGVDEDT